MTEAPPSPHAVEQASEALYARLQTLTTVGVHDGEIPVGTAADGPHVVFYGAPGSPVHRKVSGGASAWVAVASVVCVNNSGRGAAMLAAQVADLFDGWSLFGSSSVTTNVGPAIRDPDGRAGYVWSCTVQLTYYLMR